MKNNNILNTLKCFFEFNILMIPVHFITYIGMAFSTDSGVNTYSAYLIVDIVSFFISTTILLSLLIYMYIKKFISLKNSNYNISKLLYSALSIFVISLYFITMADIHINFDKSYIHKREKQLQQELYDILPI